MSWLSEHWLAAVLLVVYTLVLLYHAQVGRRESHNMRDYYVGGRNLGGVVVGISFFATFASTNSYIGHAGKGYEYGLPWMTLAVLIVIFTYVSWAVVAPRLRRFTRHWDALTLPDYLAARFGSDHKALRILAAVVILFSSLLYLVAIFKGAGNLFERFLQIPYTAAVGVTLVIVMLYTSIGGFVSVVRTDVVQGILMIFGSVTIFAFVYSAAGGMAALQEMAQRPQTEHLFTLNAALPFIVLLGIALSGSLKLLVDPRQVSRFYALKDDHSVKVGIWVAVIGIAVIQFSLFPVGVLARVLLDGVTDTDLVVPMLISDQAIFPLWVADCLIIAMVAAAMSSMDSVLLVAASVLYKDIVETFHPTAHPLTWTRIGVIGVAVVAAFVALDPPGDIVEITIFSGSLYAACFLPAILFGLHWQRGSAIGVVTSMVLGVVTLVSWMLFGPGDVVHEVFPALTVSCLAYAIIARMTPSAIQRWPDERAPGSPGGY
ncbi:MAG: sodium/solute symporter [Gammaproteobacteria bacterium]|nr:sodium/solute symporter [Gammaproteobacteria bacterium]